MSASSSLLNPIAFAMPQEYILKGVVCASMGQLTESRDHLKMAQQYFQLVGASASECDTIPGRQCMAPGGPGPWGLSRGGGIL